MNRQQSAISVVSIIKDSSGDQRDSGEDSNVLFKKNNVSNIKISEGLPADEDGGTVMDIKERQQCTIQNL